METLKSRDLRGLLTFSQGLISLRSPEEFLDYVLPRLAALVSSDLSSFGEIDPSRPPGEMEHVIFYCENCGALVEDIHFDCADIVEHFSQAMLDFWNDDARRTCRKCGTKVPQPQPVKPFKK